MFEDTTRATQERTIRSTVGSLHPYKSDMSPPFVSSSSSFLNEFQYVYIHRLGLPFESKQIMVSESVLFSPHTRVKSV